MRLWILKGPTPPTVTKAAAAKATDRGSWPPVEDAHTDPQPGRRHPRATAVEPRDRRRSCFEFTKQGSDTKIQRQNFYQSANRFGGKVFLGVAVPVSLASNEGQVFKPYACHKARSPQQQRACCRICTKIEPAAVETRLAETEQLRPLHRNDDGQIHAAMVLPKATCSAASSLPKIAWGNARN